MYKYIRKGDQDRDIVMKFSHVANAKIFMFLRHESYHV